MKDDNEQLNDITKANAIEPKKPEIVEQAMLMELSPTATDIQVDLNKATRLPYGELFAMGSTFASLPETFLSITKATEAPGEVLYRAVDETGTPIKTEVLSAFNDGSGLLGSFRDEAGNFHQARLQPAASQTIETAASVPYDPVTLFVAAALIEVNQKLDAIQETQEEMFAYLKNKDKAKLRANLEALTEILNDYRYNWGDQDYKQNKRNFVQFIKRDADQAIIHQRAEISNQLKKKNFIHMDNDVREKAKTVRSCLEEYRLSVYLYAYSSFLEIMLYGNFEEEYLEAVVRKIEDRSMKYRELYTLAYDLIEADADTSIRAVALGGLSGAMGFLGKAIESTPIGDLTPIDEALGDASEGIGSFSKDIKKDMMVKLTDARNSDVRPFVENIENVSRLYNEPVMLMADEEAIYVLPAEASKQVPRL